MKKNIQFNKKILSLNKETIAKLNEEQLRNIAGGKYEFKHEDETRNNMSCWANTCKGQTVVVG